MRPLGAIALAVCLTACGGPRPVVERVETTAAREGWVRVSVALRNASAGDGQVSLVVTLRDRASGRVLGRQEQPVELHARERVQVVLELPTDGGEVVAEAEAHYPPT